MERLDPLAKRQAKKASYKENAERREKPIPTKEQKDAEKRRKLERKQAKYLIGQTRAAEIHDAKAVKSASVREDTLRRKLAKAARYALKKAANPGPAPGALLPAAPVVPQAAASLVPPPAAPVAAPGPAPGALLPASPVVPQAAAPLVPPPAAPVAAPGPAPGALLPAAPLVPPPAAPVAAPGPAPGTLLPAAPVVPQAAAPVAAPPVDDDGDFSFRMFDEALEVEGK